MMFVFDDWWRDLRFGLRSLNRTRGLTVVVVTTLALAIAVNGVVMTFVDRLLFATPIGVVDADRVLRVANSWLLQYDQYAQLERNLASLAVAGQSRAIEVSVGSGSEAQPVQARFVTGSYFSVLGTRPVLGRVFHQGEERNSDEAVVLGYRAWHRLFGGEHSVIGTGIRVGDRLRTVVGVAPEGFAGVDSERIEVWLLVLLEIPIIEGRNFARGDYSGGAPVVIVNERLARDVFKGGSALGRCIQFWVEKTCREIVGVVRSVRPTVLRVPGLDIGETDSGSYLPAEQFPDYAQHLLIRTAGDPGPLIGVLRRRLHAVVPNAPYIEIVRLTQYRDQQLHGWQVASILFAAVGLLTLTMATIGIYSVLAFVVRQRTREIGIRLAVGATRRDIAVDALTRGMQPVIIGAGLGLFGAVSAAIAVRSLVFAIAPTDAGTMVAAALVPTLAGLGACLVPSARASRVDPALSLRCE